MSLFKWSSNRIVERRKSSKRLLNESEILYTLKRLEGELGEEQGMFIEGCERDREALPRPDLPLTVGIDGGYVHSRKQKSRSEGWFEVLKAKV